MLLYPFSKNPHIQNGKMKRIISSRVLPVFLTAVILFGAQVSCTGPAEVDHRVDHVFFIGLDGWGSYSVPDAKMDCVKALMAEGAWTLAKRTVLPSHSATNWASIFTGAGPEQHGFWECCSEKPDFEPRIAGADSLFPTLFTLLREKEPLAQTGCVHQWEGIKYIVDTLSCSYHVQVSQDVLAEVSAKYIMENKPRFAVFIFDDPDAVGHEAGHDTPQYYRKLAELDGWIARIVQGIRDAGIMDSSVIVISSDHGGIGNGHGGITMQEIQTPLIFYGKGIRKGYCFDDVPTVQYDVAATMAELLGLELPRCCTGRSIAEVFEQDM